MAFGRCGALVEFTGAVDALSAAIACSAIGSGLYDPLQQRGEVPLDSEQRKLATIVPADVVGYFRLMGRDERGMLQCVREYRKKRFELAVAHHGSRLIKLTGEGSDLK